MTDDGTKKKELANEEMEEIVGGLRTRRTGDEKARLHAEFGEPRPEPTSEE